MGYYVLVVDGDPHAVGYDYADEYAVIDVKDEEGCLKYAKENKLMECLRLQQIFSVGSEQDSR